MADACECGNERSGSIKCGEILSSCKPVRFSRRTLHHGVSKYSSTSPYSMVRNVGTLLQQEFYTPSILHIKLYNEHHHSRSDLISKPTSARQSMNVYYTHCIPPTCFGHSCGHLQGGALQRIDTSKYYRSF